MTRPFRDLMPDLRRPARFVIIRHGESEGNRSGQMQGHLDTSLSDLGREQARRTGIWLLEQGITDGPTIASPLRRATETAQIIAAEAHLAPPQPEPALKELNVGIFEGMTLSEIRRNEPAHFARFTRESWDGVPEAETAGELAARALVSWQRMIAEANAAAGDGAVPVVAVTHGGLIQWLFRTAVGFTVEAPGHWLPLVPASNCGIFLLDARPVPPDDHDPRAWFYAQWTMVNAVVGESGTPSAAASGRLAEGAR